MERKYKITIPEPCHENWDEMTPKDNGRFCMNCSKTVVDFTSMLPEEVQHYFIQNQNNKICGRFKNEQLDSVIVQIPKQILHTQTNYYKMFLLALFLTMGTTLFSCQDQNGKKQKIDKVEIVEGNPDRHTMLGEPVAPDNNQIKDETIDHNAIYSPAALDVPPKQKMGIKKFFEFINDNYVIPDKTEKYVRKIYVSFVIEKDGSLSTFKVLHDAGPGTGEEAIRVLKMTPRWIPGKFGNHSVRTSYNLPITIKNE
ncbi:hypothetical protein SAMN06265349_102586 [Flavobacterium resistens]|uniref:TonB protein C-terminal n=1 Tax=Flavobacterium resistens TaxID=443612 RepID=A0A521CIL0_9FLAO|nr:hypothetical protein [Flavobacterium resistens]MRX66674.1 hypothetical protein [Flavobacterium resistens]SMO59286.1 hypothetical protein SAMN06265349_102586 [Flavobacterium resistens]